LFRKKEREGKLPGPTGGITNPPLGVDNHNYFVLENHVKETDDKTKLRANNDQDHYALAQDPTYYETTNANPEDDYDTNGQGETGRSKPKQIGNVYNTFNDFNHHEDYDHIGDHKKTARVAAENEYSTTEAAMTQPIDDDTYNQMNQGPKTVARPDNVYGMPNASYDKCYDN